MGQDIGQLKNKIVPILKEANVTHSSLFGSVARGEARDDSDVDILVEFPEGRTLLDFVGLKLELEEVLRRKVDLVTFRGLKPILRERILSEQVPIL